MASTIDRTQLSTSAHDFIDEASLTGLLNGKTDTSQLRDVIAKSMAKEPLTLEETAALLLADTPEQIEEMFDAARQLKRDVYGNRIVLFAPLYIGNDCTNDCLYCAFRRTNKDVTRRTLDESEIRAQVEALENNGHKRVILVFGEHPRYSPEFIAECVRRVYSVRVGHGDIRRVNINAAPLDRAGYATVKEAGIGTFRSSRKPITTRPMRRSIRPERSRATTSGGSTAWPGPWRPGATTSGIGALFGLYDWRFEVLGLIAHSHHLQKHYNVGPHTISFPRLRPACGVDLDESHFMGDDEFKRLVAILRLSVPYTGLILTAREPAALRREVMAFGVSQIDAGSRIELGGYTEAGDAQCMDREQFQLGDIRSLDEVMGELLTDGTSPVSAPPATGWEGLGNISWSLPFRASSRICVRPMP